MTSADSPIVFIIDDDPRMRAATERLLKTVGLHLESFATPQDFLQRKLPDSGWTSLESLGGPQGTATAEFTDSEGRTWFGFANTVAMLDGDRVKLFSGKHCVQVGAVTFIHGKGNKIWIGGEFGLEFFDGSRFQPINPSDGGVFGGVSGIVTDAEDGLWFPKIGESFTFPKLSFD